MISNGPWDDWSWYESEEAWAVKGKGKKGKKGKGKGKCGKDSGKDGKSGSKDGSAQLADSAQGGTTTTATTFFVDHIDPSNFSFMATEEEKTSFIAQPLTPTSMVLDLGCTRAMASRVAAQDLMKFCEHNPDCGIWYHVAETTSQFTFASPSRPSATRSWFCACTIRSTWSSPRNLTSSSKGMFRFSCLCQRCTSPI